MIYWTITDVDSFWGFFEEVWFKSSDYALEMTGVALVFIAVCAATLLPPVLTKAPDQLT
ncbi:MAG: hypothetical protein P8L66_14205 [Rhodospirillaceae bacterium]|nr:hypothetical protein [Rhodospirillaceae bacterium]